MVTGNDGVNGNGGREKGRRGRPGQGMRRREKRIRVEIERV